MRRFLLQGLQLARAGAVRQALPARCAGVEQRPPHTPGCAAASCASAYCTTGSPTGTSLLLHCVRHLKITSRIVSTHFLRSVYECATCYQGDHVGNRMLFRFCVCIVSVQAYCRNPSIMEPACGSGSAGECVGHTAPAESRWRAAMQLLGPLSAGGLGDPHHSPWVTAIA